MRGKIIGRRAIGVAALMALVAVGAEVTFEKHPEAAPPTQRGVIVFSPIEVRVGYRVRSAAFNAGTSSVSCRVRLLDAVTGSAIKGSGDNTFDLTSGTGAVWDVQISADNIPSFGEVVGNVVCGAHTSQSVGASLQVFDEADTPVALYPQDAQIFTQIEFPSEG